MPKPSAVLDPYNPEGSTRHVNFTTTRTERWETDPRRCHVNYVICDSDWEAEFCRVVEAHPRTLAYVKNHALGFEIPYEQGAERHMYLPDFIVKIDDGRGPADPLNLIVEIKGLRREADKDKRATVETRWLPAINHLSTFGRSAFAELTDVFEMNSDFTREMHQRFHQMLLPFDSSTP